MNVQFAKPAPRDLDILLTMSEDFEVDGAGAPGASVFDSVRARLEAGKVHSRQDYARMAEPILRGVQQRGQAILEYLSGELEQRVAS